MKVVPLILSTGLSLVCLTGGEAQAKPQTKVTRGDDVKSCRDVVLRESKVLAGKDECLRGLSEVGLAIEHLQPCFDGVLSRDDLQTAIELRCCSMGLRIIEDVLKPFLYVNISVVSDTCGGTTYDVNVELDKRVILTRDMTTHVTADVWQKREIFSVGQRQLNSTEITQSVMGRVDGFLNAWLKANDK